MMATLVPPKVYSCLTKKPTRTIKAIIKNNIGAALMTVGAAHYEQPVLAEGPTTKNLKRPLTNHCMMPCIKDYKHPMPGE